MKTKIEDRGRGDEWKLKGTQMERRQIEMDGRRENVRKEDKRKKLVYPNSKLDANKMTSRPEYGFQNCQGCYCIQTIIKVIIDIAGPVKWCLCSVQFKTFNRKKNQ